MRKRIITSFFAMIMSVLMFSQVCFAAVTAPSISGYTTDLVSKSYSTTLIPVLDDSWHKQVTFTGFEDDDIPMYCTVTVGFTDGITSDTDYIWTGLYLTKECDVATYVYVCGLVENSKGTTSGWSSYITNGAIATKKTVKHNGTATYYVAFALK